MASFQITPHPDLILSTYKFDITRQNESRQRKEWSLVCGFIRTWQYGSSKVQDPSHSHRCVNGNAYAYSVNEGEGFLVDLAVSYVYCVTANVYITASTHL